MQKLLTEQHSDLGGFYGLAITELAAGLTYPRLVVAAHCVRELVSGLPGVLGDVIARRSDVNRPARELSEAWQASSLDFPAEVAEFDDDAIHPLPGRVYRAAAGVAAAGVQGTRNSVALTAVLATGHSGDIDDPLIRRLHAAIEFFRAWCHYRDYSTGHRQLPSVAKIEEELRIIEDALLTRLGNMADRARKLRQIIADANRQTTEERA